MGRALLLFLLLAAVGCGADPRTRLIGKWEGRVEGLEKVIEKRFDVSGADEASKKVVEGLSKDAAAASLANLELQDEFRADGTCVSSASGNQTEGTWKIADSTADTLVLERGKKGSDERKVVTLRFEGPDKYRIDTGDPNVKLVFTRKK
jgi:hypothetical protein